MPAEVVFALYQPRPGCGAELEAILKRHRPALVAAGFVTDRPTVLVRNRDGIVIEIFEWKDDAAMRAAHEHPAVRAIWDEIGAVAEFAPLAELAESTGIFPHFTPID